MAAKKCHYKQKCTNPKCIYLHDTTDGKSPGSQIECRFQEDCTNKNCLYRHHKTKIYKFFSDIQTPEQTMIHICISSWNVLADDLAEKMKSSGNYNIKNLNSQTRWDKILKTLDDKMTKGDIIGLQEVTKNRANTTLIPLALHKEYHFFYDSFGNYFNGFMGSGILIPKKRFKILDQYHEKIGKNCKNLISQKIANTMNVVVLEDYDTNTKFLVANYHMPSKHNIPIIMEEHSMSVMNHLENYTLPCILIGDFNTTPDNSHYLFFKKNMESIWKDEKYPDTTYGNVFGEFKGCIDHMFYTPQRITANTKPIEKLITIIPDDNHPSDHLLVETIFYLR
jgi:endonuclease/exonuclease/phosphatase family metal-dependent hydrolase